MPASLALVLDLLAVLIGAGEEHDIVALEALVAGHGIGGHGAVGVADVELVGGVVDGGGDVERSSFPWVYLLFRRSEWKSGLKL